MQLILILFVCILVSGRTWGQEYQKSYSKLEKCYLGKIETIKPLLQYDPLKLSHVYAVTSTNGAKMNATMRNLLVYGGSNYRTEYFKVNSHSINKITSEVKVVFPHLDITADYYFQGAKMSLTSFKTHGKFNGKFNNVTSENKYTFLPFKKNGKGYLKMDSVKVNFFIGSEQLDLTPADSTWTGKRIASFARLDPSGALSKMIPAIEWKGAQIFKNYVNHLLAKVPFKVYAC